MSTATTSITTTLPGEIGVAAAEAIREMVTRAIGGDPIATYIESESPVRWSSLSDAGWDLAGVVEDDDSATLRDLVEIAQAWGESLVQLPLLPSIIAKRHSAAALEWDGPVTISVPTKTVTEGHGLAVFGQVSGIGILDAPDASPKAADEAKPITFAPSLLPAEVPFTTTLTPELARDFCVVLAGEASGIAKRVVADAVEFVKERQQFGQPIGAFQAVKHHLANAHVAVEQSETAAIRGAFDESSWAASSLYGIGRALKAVELSTQVHGGLGITWEMGLHFSLRHLITARDVVVGVLDA